MLAEIPGRRVSVGRHCVGEYTKKAVMIQEAGLYHTVSDSVQRSRFAPS